MIYLDNAATTRPVDVALQKYNDASREAFANSASLHTAGLAAASALEKARKSVASLFRCEPGEIYFTSGGTESDNIAVLGTARRLCRRGKKIVTCAYEHSAVYKCMKELEARGFDVVYINTKNGNFDMQAFESALDSSVILISVMYVNNETGLINPIEKIKVLRDLKAPNAYIHTDAVQAFGKLPCDIHYLGTDMISCSSHKIGGVKGIGALYIKKGITVSSPVFGGGHEKGVRSGTVNVPAACAFGAAADAASSALQINYERMSVLRNYAEAKLSCYITHDFAAQSPYILSVTVPGFRGETLMHALNSHGIFVSTSSACSSNGKRDNRVLSAQGYTSEHIASTLRISFSPDNTKGEIDALEAALSETLSTLCKGVK